MAKRAKRNTYLLELATTAQSLFDKEIYDPSAEDIAEAYYGREIWADVVIEDVRSRLRRIRDVLESTYRLQVYLVNDTYYECFRDKSILVATAEEARRCIPVGNGVFAAGIRLYTGEEDLIWEAVTSHNYSTTAGKCKKISDRILNAVESGKLKQPRAARLISNGHKKSLPERLALQDEIMKLLPPEENQDQ